MKLGLKKINYINNQLRLELVDHRQTEHPELTIDEIPCWLKKSLPIFMICVHDWCQRLFTMNH
jgi:hypothetical protein